MIALLIAAGGATFSTTPSHADVKLEGKSGPPPNGDARLPSEVRLTIYGRISKADADYFTQHAAEYETDDLSVNLDSLGGDVDAAMQIGRLIRRFDASASVKQGAKCYSSCTLIYIAGVSRHNYGTIGLHRPYFASAPQSRQSVEREAPLMLQKLRAYVQEMGTTDNFYQEMVNTGPSAIRLYAGDNIKSIVPTLDPTHDEIETAYLARRFGTDTAETPSMKLASTSPCSPDNLNHLNASRKSRVTPVPFTYIFPSSN